MVTKARTLATLIIACTAVVWAGCAAQTAQAPQLRPLSDQEAEDLWNKAESHEPIGEATVRKIPGEGVVNVLCTQTYMLRMSGGGSGGGVVQACGGACKLKPGGTFETCKTSGCLANGRRCTPLVCEGGCELSQACKAEKPVGLVMW